jgi:hypothetical protein
MGLVDPLAREVPQVLEVLLGVQFLGLEARYLTCVGCLVVLGAAADHGPQGGIEAEARGVITVLVAGQAAVDRSADEGEKAMLAVVSGCGYFVSRSPLNG